MFAVLTGEENENLYRAIERGSRKLSKVATMMIDFCAYEASMTISDINGEIVDLLEELNIANKARIDALPGLAEHTAAAQEKITKAARPAPQLLDGCTCGGIGDTGSHSVGCAWSTITKAAQRASASSPHERFDEIAAATCTCPWGDDGQPHSVECTLNKVTGAS